jgi:hypothetical protein
VAVRRGPDPQAVPKSVPNPTEASRIPPKVIGVLISVRTVVRVYPGPFQAHFGKVQPLRGLWGDLLLLLSLAFIDDPEQVDAGFQELRAKELPSGR